jgi:hypothetical protein
MTGYIRSELPTLMTFGWSRMMGENLEFNTYVEDTWHYSNKLNQRLIENQ